MQYDLCLILLISLPLIKRAKWIINFLKRDDNRSECSNYYVIWIDHKLFYFFLREHEPPYDTQRPEEGRRKVRRKEERKETQRALAKAILWNPAILSGVFGDDICSDQSIRSPWQPVSLVCPPHGRSLESQSAQRMGECTRGCGTDGWLSERTCEGRTVGPGILASRTGGTVLFVSPITKKNI